jgi:NAD+ kinase
MTLGRVGILGHPLRPTTGEIVALVADSLRTRQIDTWQRTIWDAATVSPLVAGSDLVIAIGGDGAMLRAARVCALANVPVLGINAGRLGFLTEVSPANWNPSLDMLLNGQYWIEQRMMIQAVAWRGDQSLCSDEALNDVVVSRGATAHSVVLETYIDEEWATTYNADGLIVATPTGSTAYALAVGGPILPPELKNILVVPVAAHLSFERPLVLSEGATVEILVATEIPQTDVALIIDGERVGTLQDGDSVVVKASEHLSQFIRLRDRNYFYRSILDRMEPHMPARRKPNERLRSAITRKA